MNQQPNQEHSQSKFRSYIPSSESIPEFTIKTVIVGVIFGILFGAANTYLGLLVGITVSTSIPVAVMSVAFFRLTRNIFGPTNILEANMAQTIGSASSSLASGIIFTIPALFIWGMDPPLVQMAGLALAGGLIGVLFMIPLRKLLIKQEHGKLPYPEGTACAQVLIASDKGGSTAGNVFLGLGIGLLYKFATGFLQLWKDKVSIDLSFLGKSELGLRGTPALLGVGFILGPRISNIMVSGAAISWLILIPLIALFENSLVAPWFPDLATPISEMSVSSIWSNYIRYVGAGAVAFGGIITIIRSIPTMRKALGIGLKEFRVKLDRNPTNSENDNEIERTDRDLPLKPVGIGVLIILAALVAIPGLLGANASMTVRLVSVPIIAIFAFFFVTVSSRIVGLVGVSSNPTSGMTIVTLLGISTLFVLLGWTDDMGKATALMVGTVVCIASSIAGDTSQDLKTGYIVGATPSRQQIGELVGAATSALAVCAAVMLLDQSYEFGSTDLPAPQATLMKTIIEGVMETGIPWGLVIIGLSLAATAELFKIPSLPFAVGLYLPISSMTPIFFGGLIRHFVVRSSKNDKKVENSRVEKGILFSSGLIGGEGLLGVGIALYAFYVGKPGGLGIVWPDYLGEIVSVGIFGLLGYMLYKMTDKK